MQGELNPIQIVRRAISDPRYDVVGQDSAVDWKKFLYADFEKRTRDEEVENDDGEVAPMEIDRNDGEDSSGDVGDVSKKIKVVTI